MKLPDIKSNFGKKGTDRGGAFSQGKAAGTEKDSGPVYGAGAKSGGTISSSSTSEGASKMLSGGN